MQAARAPFAAFGLVDIPKACNIAGQAFLLASLAIGGAVAVTGVTSVVMAKISPVSRREGCGARGICMPSFLVYTTMCLCLPTGLTLIFHTSGGDFWPWVLLPNVRGFCLRPFLYRSFMPVFVHSVVALHARDSNCQELRSLPSIITLAPRIRM